MQMVLDGILAQGPYAGDVAPDPVFKDKTAFLGMDLLLTRGPRGVDCTHAIKLPRGPVFERIKYLRIAYHAVEPSQGSKSTNTPPSASVGSSLPRAAKPTRF